MQFQTTAAKSSGYRVAKPRAARSSPLKRSRSSSSSVTPQRQSIATDDTPRLDDLGPVRSFAGRVKLRDVMQCVKHTSETMFDEIPEQRSGLSSTRKVETRLYRRKLPPLVSISHIHALSKSPTSADREIAQLVARGILRKIHIPGRGLGTDAIGEFVVLTESWASLLRAESSLDDALKEKYINILTSQSASSSISGSEFTPEETIALVQRGFLTSTALFARQLPGELTSPDKSLQGSLISLAASGAQNASGSLDAVGGANAVYEAGAMATGSSRHSSGSFNLTVPSIGVYLKLLSSAREHMILLLSKSKFKEAPTDMLRERWDGGVQGSVHPSRHKGLEMPVLPGNTRKWKQYYGLRYQWVLEECLGTGAIECFDTGTVGLGVRLP